MSQRILICGASIAGLTTAYWLARHGFQVTVVERAPAPRPGGNGVDVRGQAREVAERMGLTAAIGHRAADVEGMKFVDAAGGTTARIPFWEADAVEIMRGDLAALLHDSVDGSVEYRFDDSITDVRQDGHGVTVGFERADPVRYDLLIGADGLHSTVRRLVFGAEDRFLRHRDHYFAFADADAALGEDRWVTMHNLPGKMIGIYRSGAHTQAKANFMFRSAPLSYDHRDVDEHRRLLHRAFADDASWQVQELLTTALADPDFYFDSLSQVDLPVWSSGRVVLVGDAAWCASPAAGAGAELAMVGAYRLAGELATARDHTEAFERYEGAHRRLVRQRQEIGFHIRLMVPGSAAGIRVRDTFARLRLPRLLAGVEGLVPVRTDTLPDYGVAAAST